MLGCRRFCGLIVQCETDNPTRDESAHYQVATMIICFVSEGDKALFITLSECDAGMVGALWPGDSFNNLNAILGEEFFSVRKERVTASHEPTEMD
jgi:hypothetical protein